MRDRYQRFRELVENLDEILRPVMDVGGSTDRIHLVAQVLQVSEKTVESWYYGARVIPARMLRLAELEFLGAVPFRQEQEVRLAARSGGRVVPLRPGVGT